jgi:ATP-binding cassette subfamily C protein
VHSVFRGVLGSLVTIATEALVVAGLVVVLGVTAPGVTLVAVVVVGGLLSVPLLLSRRAAARWGRAVQLIDTAILQTLQQSLGAVKEVKLTGREAFFLGQLGERVPAAARLRLRFLTLGASLRMAVETVFVCGLLLVSLLITLRHEPSGVLPLLGLYAYAGFRVIPSANRIMLYVTELRYSRAWIHDLCDDLAALETEPPAADRAADAIRFSRTLALESVSYTYAGEREPVLLGVDLTIGRGESVGIVARRARARARWSTCSWAADADRGTHNGGRPRHPDRDPVVAAPHRVRAAGAFPARRHAPPQRRLRHRRRRDRRPTRGERAASGPARRLRHHAARSARHAARRARHPALGRPAPARGHRPRALPRAGGAGLRRGHLGAGLADRARAHRGLEALHGMKTLVVIAHRLTTVRRCDRLAVLRDGRVAATGSYDDLLARDAGFRELASTAP